MGKPGDSRKPRVAGFSLIELVVVLAVTAVLAAVAIGRYGGSPGHHGLRAAAQRVVADLELTRHEAMAAASNRTAQFETGTGQYTLVGIPDINRPEQTYRVDLSGPPYRACIQSADLDGAGGASLTYDAYGEPVLASGLSANDVQLWLTIDSRGTAVSVIVDPSTGWAHVGAEGEQ